MNPQIGYNSVFDFGTNSILFGTDDTISNGLDWLTWDYWQANTGSGQYPGIKCDMGVATAADYFAIAAHNLGDISGIALYVEGADNSGFSVNNVSVIVNQQFSNNNVFFKSFSEITKRWWRFYFDMGTPTPSNYPVIGHAAIGKKLLLPEGLRPGFTPPNLSFDDVVTNQVAQGGAFLGRSVKREGAAGSIDLQRVAPAWVRSDWLPFIEHAREKPFFLSWDETNYAGEAAFCWSEKKIRPPVYSHSLYMDVGIDFKGLAK